MRQLRAGFFTLACVVGAVLGTAGATHSGSPVVSRSADCTVPSSCAGRSTQVEALARSRSLPPVRTFPVSDSPLAGGPLDSSGDPRYGPGDPLGGSGDRLYSRPAAGPVSSDLASDPASGPQPAGVGPQPRHARFEATAVRHVATPTQPASDDSMDPMIDKALVLVIGWVMLMALGGGAVAGRRAGSSPARSSGPPARPAPRQPAHRRVPAARQWYRLS